MNKTFTLKAKKERELLKAAKPVVTILSTISNLQKKIATKESQPKSKKLVPGEIEKLKAELKKAEKELEKMGEEKIAAGKEAIRFLIKYNQNLVKYIVKGYSFFNRQIDSEELVSEGIASIPKAAEKFDLNSKNRFATYAGHWVKQHIQSFINKNQFINQSSTTKEKKNVIYYDNNYHNDDKESKSYSLVDTLHDDENSELIADQVRHQDTIIQTNNLINSLESREAILLVRLLYKIKPSNLADIYYLATEEEKKELKKKMKLNAKAKPESLEKFSLEEKKISSLPSVKNYLSLFSKSYKFPQLSKLISRSENATRKLKQESFKKLQKLAKERNLYFLVE